MKLRDDIYKFMKNELKMANILSTVDKSIAQAYVEKTGATEAQVLEWMNREEGLWLDANKCVELHFADEVIHNKKFVITNSVCGDLSMTPDQVEKIKNAMEEAKNKEKAVEKEILGDLYMYGF